MAIGLETITVPLDLWQRLTEAGLVDAAAGTFTSRGHDMIEVAISMMRTMDGPITPEPLQKGFCLPARVVTLRYPPGEEKKAQELAAAAEAGKVVLLPQGTHQVTGKPLWELEVKG